MKRMRAAVKRRKGADEGFTIVEMMVTLLLIALVLTALASVLMGSLKALAVQKSRTRANDIATEAIEDLQRYDFNSLGLCATATELDGSPLNPPAGLTDLVRFPCTAPSFSEPCANAPAASGATLVPKAVYICNRAGTDPNPFEVHRYIAWAATDPPQTAKRLAVYVDWTDSAGRHQVSQQSSLKAPDQGAVIGLGPPIITTVVITPTAVPVPLTGAPGTIAGSDRIDIAVETENNSSCTPASDCYDSVYASIRTLEPNNGSFIPVTSSVSLTPDADGDSWTGAILPGTFQFSPGSQYITIGVVRNLDGEQNSKVADQAVEFACSGCTATAPSFATTPTFSQGGTNLSSPPNIIVQPNGTLTGDVELESIETDHLTDLDAMVLTFPTKSGAQSVNASRESCIVTNLGSGPVSRCRWSVVLPTVSGYLLTVADNQKWYLTGQQAYAPGNLEDYGSTVALAVTVNVRST